MQPYCHCLFANINLLFAKFKSGSKKNNAQAKAIFPLAFLGAFASLSDIQFFSAFGGGYIFAQRRQDAKSGA
jgi:hypothetical protein